MKLPRISGVVLLFLVVSIPVLAQSWNAKLDGEVSFYQTTELGLLVAGTSKSLYVIDAATGETMWRRKDVRLEETDVAPVPGTDLLLLSFDKGDKTRVEAVDILTGDSIWRSEKIKGGLMHLAVDPQSNLLAVVLVKDPKDKARNGLKRHPLVHVLDLSSGDELWKYEASEVEMMPTRWPEDDGKEVAHTLDNFYPPVFVDGRLYLFYEGVTSFDARGGKERLREKYKVNEDGLALTEAEPIFSDSSIYVSGRGHVRAISRETGDTVWEAKDLELTPEMLFVDNVIYVRTGGIFSQLKSGETVERGSYGVSAVNARTGKVVWRYKGADKGITNLLLPNINRIAVADRDDLIVLDTQTGKRTLKVGHHIEKASFGVLNERGDVVIGGQSEIAAFDPNSGRELWRVRRTPPGRGLFKTITAIAARAASLYFRYGGTAMTTVRGVQVARAVTSLSWSGLAARSSFSSLQSLAMSSARTYGDNRFRRFGILARTQGNNTGGINVGTLTRKRSVNIEDRLLDRIDPANQLDRLSRYLWHKERLAALRGQWMYFYTDLKTQDGNGLAGVNINNGAIDREIRMGELDERFITDEVLGQIYLADGNRLIGRRLH
jgi:outer membrane protein assembly factor BamB